MLTTVSFTVFCNDKFVLCVFSITFHYRHRKYVFKELFQKIFANFPYKFLFRIVRIFAISLENEFVSSTDNSQISDMFGIRSKNIFSGTASGRDVTGNMVAVEAWNSIEQTGGSTGITRAVGFRYRFDTYRSI